MSSILRLITIVPSLLFLVFLVSTSASIRVFSPHTLPEQKSTRALEPETEQLLTQLRSSEPEVRREAAMRLSHIEGSAVTTALLGALADSSSVVRATVVTGLGERGDTSAITALSSILTSDKDVFVRKTAAYALGRYSGEERNRALIAALKDKEAEVRGAAVVSLGEHTDASLVTPLSTALSDKSSFVRARAAAGLGAIGSAAGSSVPSLVELLNSDPDLDVKRHIANALGSIGDRSALPALRAAAENTDPYLARNARASIKQLER